LFRVAPFGSRGFGFQRAAAKEAAKEKAFLVPD
jgi:hypothetical protein